MKIIAISGATSFLGSNTVSYLLSKGYFIYAMVRNQSPNLSKLPQHENLHIVEFSFDSINDVFSKIQKADCFINFAWDSFGGRTNGEIQESNIISSMKALELCKHLRCQKFIFPGSQAEYGIVNGKMHETLVCNPVSEYGKAKLAFGRLGKEYADENEIDFIHLRIFSVYGYGDRPGTLIDYCLNKFANNETAILGQCNQIWNYLYIQDFVKIIEKIIEADVHTTILNIAGMETKCMRCYVEEIYQATEMKGSFSYASNAINAESSPSLEPDISKLLSIIGPFDFTMFCDGIRKTAAKYLKSKTSI